MSASLDLRSCVRGGWLDDALSAVSMAAVVVMVVVVAAAAGVDVLAPDVADEGAATAVVCVSCAAPCRCFGGV